MTDERPLAPPAVVIPDGSPRPAVLLDRPNRYLAHVSRAGHTLAAHVPNPGRMRELMVPGRPLQIVAREPGTAPRRTSHDVQAVWHDGVWVCIDNRLGAKLVRAALEQRAIPELQPYELLEREVALEGRRLDYRLTHEGERRWVELKSCTLIVDGVGRFPDAPTERGRHHVELLAARVAAGERATVLFLVQRPDAGAIGPNDGTDPAFGAALRAAADAGVGMLAYTSTWTPAGLALGRPLPVDLT